MNSHDRRKHRRLLMREWPYFKAWPLQYYVGDKNEIETFRTEFEKWIKSQGLTREVTWRKENNNGFLYPKYYIHFRKEEHYLKYILTWDAEDEVPT